MVTDYSNLVGQIYWKLGSKTKFAEKMGFSRVTLDKKLSSKTAWTQTEIRKACEILDIEKDKIPTYFFAD